MGALLVVTALAGCQSPSSDHKPVGATNSLPAIMPLAIMHGPFLQAPSETGVTISWATSRKCVPRVEYRPELSKEWLTNTPVHHGLVDADVTYQSVPLTGLKPGTRYVYRVVSREIADFKFYRVTFGGTVISAEHRFTTLDARKPATSFVVLNDRHEKVVPLAASLASVKWTNVDLAFLNGDMVNAVKDEPQLYQCVVDPCTQNFAATIPLVYVRGNHDTRGSFARRLLDYFPTDSGRYYYTLQHGPVSFLVLDCGEDKGDENVEYYGLVDFEPYMRQQVQWLARALEEPAFQKARFRVCFLHVPPAQKSDPKFIRPHWLQDNVVPLLNQGKIDLLISAHTHKYSIQPAGTNGLNFPMITGGTETVIRCDVTADQIRVTSTDLSGKPIPQLPPVKLRTKE
ncbi:MAG: FN3 domain-containing metallophosphoesterase family protein [Verrucomicrobia bacterium]|nr:FN3 domain-containing metallophosphoesterase family protein [Verrucomicrobiota bacterium]